MLKNLGSLGFSACVSAEVTAWLERAHCSGLQLASLAVLLAEPLLIRVAHRRETTSIPPRLLRILETCRRRGWLPAELVERMVEALRLTDARIIDESELTRYLESSAFLPQCSGEQVFAVLDGAGGLRLDIYN